MTAGLFSSISYISFSSFQIEPTKRPTFSDIVTSLEKICNLLKEDSDDQITRKRKGENINLQLKKFMLNSYIIFL